MLRIQSHLLGIDQSSTILFSDFQHNGEMWTGQGDREFRKEISFSEPFAAPPKVQLNAAMWDFDHETNQRGDLLAEEITETGFVLVFKTWGDTRVARLRASWTAFGPLRSDDDWVVE